MRYFSLTLFYFFGLASAYAENCINNEYINKNKEFGVTADIQKIRDYSSVFVTTYYVTKKETDPNISGFDFALSTPLIDRVTRGVRGLKFSEKGEFKTDSALPAKFLITKKDDPKPNLGYMKSFDVAVELEEKTYAVISLLYFENPETETKTKEFENFLKEKVAKSICKM